MKLIAACVALVAFIAAFDSGVQLASAAVAAGSVGQPAVGLYAPDRYDGIPEMCLMPMDFGYCRAKVKRYYFDMRRMKCAMFYFGGCAGNINNFKSLDECNKICLDESYISNNNNNSPQNSKNINLNNSNLKPGSSYTIEPKRKGAKIYDNTNNRNDNFDDQDGDEDYQQ